METEDRNYRLRLGFPELSQPYLGNWLTPINRGQSLSILGDGVAAGMDQLFLGNWISGGDKSVSHTFTGAPVTFSSASHFVKSNGSSKSDFYMGQNPILHEGTEQNGFANLRFSQQYSKAGDGESLSDPKDTGEEVASAEKKFLSDLWLQVGRMPAQRPRLRQWELCHELEGMLQEMLLPEVVDKIQLGRRIWQNGALLSDMTGFDQDSSFCSQSNSRNIMELDLVRDALYALQGIPTAVTRLEQLSAIFSGTAADRSSHNLRTLWLRSSSMTALGKVLAEFARAGRLACQLEAFVTFFLDADNREKAALSLRADGRRGLQGSKRRKRKRRNSKSSLGMPEIENQLGTISETQENRGLGSGVSPHCLVNQAFAAAVRTIIQGKVAALNTLGASVSHRRQTEDVGVADSHFMQMPDELLEKDPGLVIGFGCGDITLLELYLHTHRLREQLQALAAVCMIQERAFSDSNDGNWLRSKNMAENEGEGGRGIGFGKGSVSTTGGRFSAVGSKFEAFPRGAELLTYLYNKLSEADPLHLELLRFLFERACQPYTGFIRLWLYHATVQDPYQEFIVKPSHGIGLQPSSSSTLGKIVDQAALSSFQVRQGVSVPSFLEDVCNPLLRAGQQLQVLLKLLETRQFAPHVANFPIAPTNGSQGSPSNIGSDFLNDESSVPAPVLHFNKHKLQRCVQQREKRSQIMKKRFDRLFAQLASSHMPEKDEGGRLQTEQELIPPLVINSLRHKVREELASPRGTILERPPKAKSQLAAVSLLTAKSREDQPRTNEEERAVPHKELEVIQQITEHSSIPPASKELKPRKTWHSNTDFQLSERLDFKAKTSLISDYQRGTSWPIWGLPANPFLLSLNRNDTSSHAYTHAVFHWKDRHWDIAVHWGDPMRMSSSGAFGLEGLEEKYVGNQRAPICNQRAVAVEPEWFTSLEQSFQGQLFRGLDEQILQEQFYSLGIQFEREERVHWSSYDSGSQALQNSICMGSFDPSFERNTRRSLHPHPGGDVMEMATLDAFGNPYFVEEVLSPRKLIEPNSLTASQDKSIAGTNFVQSREQHAHPSAVNLPQTGGSGISGISPKQRVVPGTPSTQKDSQLFFHGQDVASVDNEKIESTVETETVGAAENVEPPLVDSQRIGTGATWETYLGFESEVHPRKISESVYEAESCEDEEDSDEEIPLVVVVDKCIVQEILSQYQCVSMFTVQLLQEGLCLQDHYTALRRYYFMERGDWAEYFLTALCQHRWGPSGGQPRLLEVQGMLEMALQWSSCEGDEYAERLHVFIQNTSETNPSSLLSSVPGFTGRSRVLGSLVSCKRLDAFDFIKLGYKVEWPLSLVLTSSSLSLYSSIFSFLMRTKLTVYALAEIWRYLQVIGRSLDKATGSPDYQQQKEQFRTLQLFRQQIGHVVTTVQRYVESQLLHVVWSKFLHCIQHQVKDIHDLEKVHSAYLEDASHQCFLSRNMEGVKACIDTIMQCTLDFRANLSNASQDREDNPHELISDDLYSKVQDVKYAFTASLRKLYSYHQRPEPQYRILLSDLWMCLDFNGFLSCPQS